MKSLKHFYRLFFDLLQRRFFRYTHTEGQGVVPYSWYSRFLARRVEADIFLPPDYGEGRSYPVLFFNDGQDLGAIGLQKTLQRLWKAGELPAVVVVGFRAGDRMQEYGVIGRPDYLKRGSKAARYAQAILLEFLPHFRRRFAVSSLPSENVFAGFSLGGLSAFDLVWNHPHFFGKAGVFSGSFWWRARPFDPNRPDAHRIMHEVVSASHLRPGIRFWFQTGTEDERSDRNHNGVIDSIDDTLDLIEALRKLGYPESALTYVEVEKGRHEPRTWGEVLPVFLQWAFPEKPEQDRQSQKDGQ